MGRRPALHKTVRGKFEYRLEKTNTPDPKTGLPIELIKRPKPKVGKAPSQRGAFLTPAKKGEVRNPWGSKGKDGKGGLPQFMRGAFVPISSTLKKFSQLECIDPTFVKRYGPGLTIAQAIGIKTLESAMKNDYHAREFFADRTEGKVVTPILVNDGSIHVTISGIQEAEHVVVESEDVTDEEK